MHPKADIAVIVGRFQVDELHEGHIDLIRSVTEVRYRRVIIALGVAPNASKENPLDFINRQKMIQREFSDVTVVPINDNPCDMAWSRELDGLIRSIAPHGEVVLFGSRDSFVERYHGRFTTIELEGNKLWSGTKIRRKCSREVRSSADFRAGIIYARMNEYDRALPTVDIAPLRRVIDESKGWEDRPVYKHEILLGRKEGRHQWRFPGGHVERQHASFEHAAKCELEEETGLKVSTGDLGYVASHNVDDWRATPSVGYQTILYTCFPEGDARVGDDLTEVRWFPVEDLDGELGVPIEREHKDLVDYLLSYLKVKGYYRQV